MSATMYRTSVSGMADRPETRAADLLDLIFDRPAWRYDALCRGDLRWFDRPTEEAAEICRRCPVAGDCEAAGANEPYGTWAGQRKAGLAKETIADRVLDVVACHPYTLTRKEIEGRTHGASAVRIRQAIRSLVEAGRLSVYEVESASEAGTRMKFVYGLGEVKV